MVFNIQTKETSNNANDDEKDEFYNQLQDAVSRCSSQDMIVVMGDLGVKVAIGCISTTGEVLGKFGVGSMDDDRVRLCNFCSANGLSVASTVFNFHTKRSMIKDHGPEDSKLE